MDVVDNRGYGATEAVTTHYSSYPVPDPVMEPEVYRGQLPRQPPYTWHTPQVCWLNVFDTILPNMTILALFVFEMFLCARGILFGSPFGPLLLSKVTFIGT